MNAVVELNGVKGTPLRFAAEAVKDNADDAHDLVRLLVSKGATLAEDEKGKWQAFVDGDTGTSLFWAARAARHFPRLTSDGGRGWGIRRARRRCMHLLPLLSAGMKLADDETAEFQKDVDAVHEKWSVPIHKRDADFQMQSMANETVECPICMDEISRSSEFVESDLCYHFMCIKCYASRSLKWTWHERPSRAASLLAPPPRLDAPAELKGAKRVGVAKLRHAAESSSAAAMQLLAAVMQRNEVGAGSSASQLTQSEFAFSKSQRVPLRRVAAQA